MSSISDLIPERECDCENLQHVSVGLLYTWLRMLNQARSETEEDPDKILRVLQRSMDKTLEGALARQKITRVVFGEDPEARSRMNWTGRGWMSLGVDDLRVDKPRVKIVSKSLG